MEQAKDRQPVDSPRAIHVSGYPTAMTLRPHLLRSLVFLTPVAISLVVLLTGMGFSILAGLGSVSGGRGLDLGADVDSGLSLIGLGGAAVFGMVWIVSLFVPVREVVAEDGMLLEDRAQAVSAVYDSIKAKVERHNPPFTVSAGLMDENPTLRITNEDESALVVVHPAGPDLRIGWTLWRTRSTASMVLDTFPGRRGDDLVHLRADSCAAMGQLLQNALEHGASAAD
jgi:hypothetical protein